LKLSFRFYSLVDRILFVLRYIVVAIIAVFLHSTNPSFDEFHGYITNSIQFGKEGGSIFDARERSITEDMLAVTSSRVDYIFFSIFSIDPNKFRLLEGGKRDRVKFLGLAGKFFLIAGSPSPASRYSSLGDPSTPASLETLPAPSPDKDCFRTGCTPEELETALKSRSDSTYSPSWSGRSRESNCFRTGCSAAELKRALP